MAPGPPGAARPMSPMLAVGGRAGEAVLRPGAPVSWLFEPKLDGLRCQAVRNGGRVELFSRNGLLLGPRFPALVEALVAVAAPDFVLDGEVVGLKAGRPDFGALQRGEADEVAYWVFDLLQLLGRDTRPLPLEDRKALLAQLIEPHGPLVLVKPLVGEPRALLQASCREGWEGLVAKRTGSAYRGGRSGDWVKLKCSCRQELVVGGFTRPRGSRAVLGALLVGYYRSSCLEYAGRVGSGFDGAALADLGRRLAALERPTSPFAGPVPGTGALWVEPVLVAEVAFSNWTEEGRLRHPSFLGLRPDKPARQVVREECLPLGGGRRGGARGARA